MTGLDLAISHIVIVGLVLALGYCIYKEFRPL